MRDKTDSKPKRGGIASFLRAYAVSGAARFHMPGHKGQIARWEHDITEIPGADCLIAPEALIADAQREAAHAFGAAHTFFITNGATAGVIAMILALPPQTKVALARNCHKSAIAGIALAGHDVHFIHPAIDAGAETTEVITAADIENAFCQSPNIGAVVITRPDYCGRCPDIAAISALCRDRGVALLVDQAHGAHFSFSDRLPDSAAFYADAWTDSAHKTLVAPNQAAYLHIGHRSSLDPDRLAAMLGLVQTTSPSYPTLAALDDAWRIASDGSWTRHVERLADWTESLPRDWRDAIPFADVQRDPTRLEFDVQRARGLTGYEAEQILFANGVTIEMADSRRIAAITTPLDPDAWYVRLREALIALPHQPTHARPPLPRMPLPPTRIISIREAGLGRTERVPLQSASGRISAQSVGLYPPGIALITPGERFDPETIAYLTSQLDRGARPFGLASASDAAPETLCLAERALEYALF